MNGASDETECHPPQPLAFVVRRELLRAVETERTGHEHERALDLRRTHDARERLPPVEKLPSLRATAPEERHRVVALHFGEHFAGLEVHLQEDDVPLLKRY